MIIGYAYSNNGYIYRLSWGNDLAPGEIFFQYMPSSDQLNAMFPAYNNGPPQADVPIPVGRGGYLAAPDPPLGLGHGVASPPGPPWGNRTGGMT